MYICIYTHIVHMYMYVRTYVRIHGPALVRVQQVEQLDHLVRVHPELAEVRADLGVVHALEELLDLDASGVVLVDLLEHRLHRVQEHLLLVHLHLDDELAVVLGSQHHALDEDGLGTQQVIPTPDLYYYIIKHYSIVYDYSTL